MMRIERVARAILRHATTPGGPLLSVLAELELTLELLDSTRALFNAASQDLERIELDVGTLILRLQGPSQERQRLTQRLHDIQLQRRRLDIERTEQERKTALELLRLVNTHAALQGH